MPLTLAPLGQPCTVRKIMGKSTLHHHLACLGFVEGSIVTVVSQYGESVIVAVKESRIAIEKAIACRIMI